MNIMDRKQLTKDEIRPKLPFNINHGMADISLGRKLEDDFDFDVYLPSKGMNLQRPLVWTPFQKAQLVLSVLKGIKLPPISVLKHVLDYEDRKYVYQVIDGKQRLTTLIEYINDGFYIEHNQTDYYFSDLHPYLQRDILDCITANIGYDYPDKRVSDDVKIQWFEMINFAGTPQDVEHLNNLKKKK